MINTETVIIIALFFYIFIPGAGAFAVRRSWRDFRKKLTGSSKIAQIDFHTFRKEQNKEYLGIYKFYGNLEAVQGRNEIWLRSENFTVSVDMEKAKIYMIPAFSFPEDKNSLYEENRTLISDEMPQIISWERFHSISQGSSVMVSGPLFVKNGKAIFRNRGNEKITFLIYDGKPETVLRRGIWAGRHRNEYWNYFTPVSLVAGSFALFLAAYYLYSLPGMKSLALASLGLSLVPYMPLFPPGVILFFVYRFLWKKGRFLRAERDLILLPMLHFKKENLKEDEYCCNIDEKLKYCFTRIYNRSDAEKICREKGLKIRQTGFLKTINNENQVFYYFRPEYQSDNVKNDPVFEEIIIKGDPAGVSSKCRKLSKILEYAAAASIISGIALNFFMTYYLILTISGG